MKDNNKETKFILQLHSFVKKHHWMFLMFDFALFMYSV